MARLSVVAFLRQFIEEEDVVVFDGATIVMPDGVNGEGNLELSVTLTSGGSPISAYAFALVYVLRNDLAFPVNIQDLSQDNVTSLKNFSELGVIAVLHYDPALAPYNLMIVSEGSAGSYQAVVVLPSGGIVMSSAVVIEEPPPP